MWREQVLGREGGRFCIVCLSHAEPCWGEARRLEMRFSGGNGTINAPVLARGSFLSKRLHFNQHRRGLGGAR